MTIRAFLVVLSSPVLTDAAVVVDGVVDDACGLPLLLLLVVTVACLGVVVTFFSPVIVVVESPVMATDSASSDRSLLCS